MKLDKYFAEEIGAHVGDGSMNIYSGSYCYTFAGHHEDDKEYVNSVIIPLIKRCYDIAAKPRFWSVGTYGFRVHSKEMVNFKQSIGLPLGNKQEIEIPENILKDDDLMKSFLRGLFDTDGSITLWKTNNSLYPRIYFVTISQKLFVQTVDFLKKQGFRVTVWENVPRNKKWKKNYRLSINGIKMLEKWFSEIGFNNPKNVRKFELLRNVYKEN